jgi:uncharacterized protein
MRIRRTHQAEVASADAASAVSPRVRELDRMLQRLDQRELGEFARLLLAHRLRMQRGPLRKLELVVTEDCNLRCDYCWVTKRGEYMNWETAREAIDYLLFESAAEPRLQITFFGGEPLLAWDLVAKAVEYGSLRARKAGKTIGWSITTNGTLLQEDMVRFAHANGFNFLLSLDGVGGRHDLHRRFPNGGGSFERAAAALPLLRRHMGWIGARMTVNPDTCEGLSTDVRALTRLGVNQFIIGVNPDATWTADRIRSLEHEWIGILDMYVSLRSAGWPIRMTCFERCDEEAVQAATSWGCEAGRDKVAVTPDGQIYACSRFLGDDGMRARGRLGALDAGIIAEDNLHHITDSRDEIRYRCRTCALRDKCTGGCPATNLSATGSLYVSPLVDCRLGRFWERMKRRRPEAWEVHKLESARASCPGGVRPLN